MHSFNKLLYNKPILIDDQYFYEGINQKIYLEKSFLKNNQMDQYFLKLYLHMPNGQFICQGYIYFYLDFKNRESDFIGIYIKPEYRNRGLASLLVANWIKICFDNDIYNLSTNKKQRKPFLLYLLKTYYFELDDFRKYEWSKFTINICQDKDGDIKYLLFKDQIQKEHFKKSHIMKEDNYHVLDELTNDFEVMDSVILSDLYYVQDGDLAYKKSLKIIDKKSN